MFYVCHQAIFLQSLVPGFQVDLQQTKNQVVYRQPRLEDQDKTQQSKDEVHKGEEQQRDKGEGEEQQET